MICPSEIATENSKNELSVPRLSSQNMEAQSAWALP